MPVPAETTPVRPPHRLDEAALARHLAAHLPGFAAPLAVRQFEGGQSNPTFHLAAASGEYVLRKKPPGHLLPSAHQVEREHRILRALAGTAVPVPRVHLFCEDAAIVGTPFYVMDYVPGRVFRDSRLPGLTPAERRALIDSSVDVLASLHAIDPASVGLGDLGRPGNYYARQVSRWTRQYEAAKSDAIASMDALLAWLPANLPPEGDTAIVHGDYRIENLIVHQEDPRVVSVVDWELSTLGDPLADLAHSALFYHVDLRTAGPMVSGPEDSADSRPDPRPPEGVPAEAEYVGAYCRRRGIAAIERWNFYVAFALFRMASIAQGVYARGLQGNASSETALGLGAEVRRLADRAWEAARRY